MTVWLIVFLLANGEQAQASSLWRTSKYECEQLRHTMDPDATARGWTTRCVAWEIPDDFALEDSGKTGNGEGEALAASCDTGQLLRRLDRLTDKVDGIDSSVQRLEGSSKTMSTSLRDVERSVKRVDVSVRAIRCYR